MKISILTLFPEMFNDFLNTSIIKKARLKGLVEIECIDIRLFTTNKHHRVDDYPFGGGQGLVLAVQPVRDALASVVTSSSHVLMTSASGSTLTQKKVRQLAGHDHVVILCGHYEGFDERIKTLIHEEISIGDYILTGGELPAMVLTDAIARLGEGVIRESSHLDESFETGLLEYPHYTKPVRIDDQEVPAVLLSGHHEEIRKYRLKESLRKTWMTRPDLFKDYELSKEETLFLIEILQESLKKA